MADCDDLDCCADEACATEAFCLSGVEFDADCLANLIVTNEDVCISIGESLPQCLEGSIFLFDGEQPPGEINCVLACNNCIPEEECVPEPEICNNFLDDDCDNFADCFDPDCAQAPNCAPGEVG